MKHKPFTVGAVLNARSTPTQRHAQAMAHLDSIRGFMPAFQAIAIEQLMRGEERQFFYDKLEEYAKRIAEMPSTGDQDAMGAEAIAYLHYFAGGADWYIMEKDIGGVGACILTSDNMHTKDDCTLHEHEPEDPALFQSQAFGYARLIPGGGECGYISLPEAFRMRAELDLHFTPASIAEIKRKLGES